MISLSWHYDLNGLGANIVPDVNGYIGIGKNYNFGFGAQFPLFISHASIVKYMDIENDNNNNWAIYAHMNEIFGANNNPAFEIGGMRNWGKASISQNISFGIGFGQQQAWAVDKNAKRLSWVVLPTLKYRITGSDVGLSLIHHNGQTKSAVLSSLPDILKRNDTLYIIKSGNLDSISTDTIIRAGFIEKITFFEKGGKSIVFNTSGWCPDCFYMHMEALQNWLGGDYMAGYFNGNWNSIAVINLNKFKSDWEKGKEIIITRYPEQLVNRVKKLNSLTNDYSFGFGVFGYPK
ncbi:MAG: hypothetical protein GY865_17985 [candidate division Zixibacteria bacterium]|nr:hypothetical protein [candidate division Zixibacteria bacterium]